VTLGFDVAFDVAIYYFLHWLANHMPTMPWSRHRDGPRGMSYFRDATLVQFERAMLGPVYYGMAVAVQYALLHFVDRELAAILGLCSGLATTRILHTLWMLRTERRRALARMTVVRCIGCGHALTGPGAGCPQCARLAAEMKPEARKTVGAGQR
jgi:hypothetical protein